MGGVTRDNGQAVVQAGRGDDEVGLREGVPSLTAILDQQSPFEHDVFRNLKNTLLKHRPHLVR